MHEYTVSQRQNQPELQDPQEVLVVVGEVPLMEGKGEMLVVVGEVSQLEEGLEVWCRHQSQVYMRYLQSVSHVGKDDLSFTMELDEALPQ